MKKMMLIDACELMEKQANIARVFAKSEAQKALMGRVVYNTSCAKTIDAIPVDFIKWRMDFAQENGFNEAYEAFAFVLRAWKTTGKLWEQEAR